MSTTWLMGSSSCGRSSWVFFSSPSLDLLGTDHLSMDRSRKPALFSRFRSACDNQKIGSAVDNLSFDPATGTTYFALFPSRTQLYHHFHNPLNSSQRAPSAIGKLVPGGWELVYRDEGTLLADGTVGVSDQVAGVSLVGGVMTRGTVVCAKAF